MYIAPNSIIRCLSGVPIDNTYRNTLWWNTAAEQEAYFWSKNKIQLTAQSYQRVNRGYLKIAVPVEQLYDCNYLMFQNTSFGNKWFYAFITNIEYINNTTTRVEYELDVMQTWFFDYTLDTNFVEREHSVTDVVGENIIDEGLEIGELTPNAAPILETHTSSNYQPIIAATFNATWNDGEWVIDSDAGGALYNACYSGLYFINAVNAPRANLLIKTAVEQLVSDGIVGMFMYPAEFMAGPGGGVIYFDNAIQIQKPAADNTYPAIHGYTPKNKKLYTYPYSQMLVTDGGQMTLPLRYENFSGNTCSFRLIGEMAFNPSIALVATNYKNLAGTDPMNAVLMSGFPMCPYSTDTFKAYIAQTYGPVMASMTPEKTQKTRQIASGISSAGAIMNDVMGIAEAAYGIATLPVKADVQSAAHLDTYTKNRYTAHNRGVSALLDNFGKVFDSVHEVSSTFLESAQAHGANSDTALTNFGFKGFRVYQLALKYDYAVTVDNFFTMFGYATKKLKVPNRNSRPHFNYVKLVNTHIEGGIPFDHESEICQIYDNGITFWKNPAEVGHYELDNRPV